VVGLWEWEKSGGINMGGMVDVWNAEIWARK